jgi:hypothetical protein
MADSPLATPNDCARFGFGTVSAAALAKASARARRVTGQHISTQLHSIAARGPRIILPGRPVQAVADVLDRNDRPVRFELRANGLLLVDTDQPVAVTYTSGWAKVPDHVVEIICTIAARLDSLNPALAGGVQQESGGAEAATYGWDSFQGVGDLVSSEKKALASIFPRRAGLIVQAAS